MDYNEFAQKVKTKYPEYNDMDNLELAQKIVAKYPEYAETVTFEQMPTEQNKGVDISPRAIGERIGNALSSAIVSQRDNIPYEEAYKQSEERLKAFNQEPLNQVGNAIGDMALYSVLPILKGGGVLNFAGNALIQGGILGAIEGLKEGEPLKGASTGTAVAAGINAILPAFAKGLSSKAVKNIMANSIPWLKPETVKQVVKPNSIALDLNEDTAQNLLMNTTEQVRSAYNDILNKKGRRVGELLEELPKDVKIKAGDVLNDYEKIYNNYSLSKNPTLNPARNATTKELSKIQDMLYSNGAENVNEFLQNVDNIKYPKNNLEVIRGKHKGQFFTKSLDSLENNIELATRKFNADVLERIKSNPDALQNPKAMQYFENVIEDIRRHVPDEIADEMYAKLYSVLEDSAKLDKANYTVSPKELYDINKNISDMTDWKAVDSATKNDVLEQMYGMNAKRISNLSPNLAEANKEYSQLMDFRNNEGIDRILNKRERIDNASSALKNYNNTITKGNQNRNIQDLENIIVNNGGNPFLNTIDDVNAAQDLLSTPTTGFNPFGLTNMTKRLTNPVLKGVRGLNRANINWAGLSDDVRRLLTIGAVKGSVPMLYGGISND